MELDHKLKALPLTKSNPKTLNSIFGSSDMIPMWVADMDFQIAAPIQEALQQRINHSGFAYEYKPDSFYSAQKKWYKEHYQIDLNQEEILYSPTITTSITVLIETFTTEKAGVIIQPPVFMEFKDVVRKTRRKLVKNPLKLVGNHYQIDFEDLEEKAKLEDNQVLVICNPHNPVGRVWTKEELAKVVAICKENGLLLISDEIHKDIILFENHFTSALHFTEDYENIVVCTSEAKSFNLCGIADSMAIIPNEAIRKAVSTVFKKYNLGRTNALTRVALETAYTAGQLWLEQVISVIEENIVSVEAEIKDSKIQLIRPEGTYQVWLDFSALYSDTKAMFKELTTHSGIALNAGHWFGREGALFMRMNIATTNEKVIKAIRKIKNTVAK